MNKKSANGAIPLMLKRMARAVKKKIKKIYKNEHTLIFEKKHKKKTKKTNKKKKNKKL